jgi:hypothetical protein
VKLWSWCEYCNMKIFEAVEFFVFVTTYPTTPARPGR